MVHIFHTKSCFKVKVSAVLLSVSFIFYRTQDKDIDAFSPIKPAESMARKIKKEKKHDYILGFLLLTSEKEVRFQLL